VCVCVYSSSAPRVLKMTREREKETRVYESKKKRQRKDHFFSSFLLQTNTRRGNRLASVSSFFFLFFFFAKHKHKKVVENFVRLKIDMGVWI